MIAFGTAQAIVLAVAGLRLAELMLARRHDRRLRAAGGIEHGAAHYPLFVVLHTGWLVALLVLAPADRGPAAGWLALFLAAMALRFWAIAALGERWTTRVIVLPGTPVVASGPYRWLRHPNYLAVAVELYALGFALDAPWVAILFGTLNLPLLGWRIRIEDRALRGAAEGLRSAP